MHGAFGAFIPVGIRIGLDALARLKAEPRGVSVVYYNGDKPPCPCVADGVMIATQASPGQGTLQIAPEKAPAGFMAVIVIRNRKTGEAKLKIKEMGSRYLFICLYVWLEKYFSRGDYKKK